MALKSTTTSTLCFTTTYDTVQRNLYRAKFYHKEEPVSINEFAVYLINSSLSTAYLWTA